MSQGIFRVEGRRLGASLHGRKSKVDFGICASCRSRALLAWLFS